MEDVNADGITFTFFKMKGDNAVIEVSVLKNPVNARSDDVALN